MFFILLLSGELDCCVTGDVLGQMMLAKDDTGEGMTDLELEDEVMTLMLAGFEVSLQVNYVLLDYDRRQMQVISNLLACLGYFCILDDLYRHGLVIVITGTAF